jgi:hypothetical protein
MRKIFEDGFASKLFSQQSSWRRHSHSCKLQDLTAIIRLLKVSQGFFITVRLYAGDKLVFSDFVRANDCRTSERAWLAGYNCAQRLAENYSPEAPLYVEAELI